MTSCTQFCLDQVIFSSITVILYTIYLLFRNEPITKTNLIIIFSPILWTLYCIFITILIILNLENIYSNIAYSITLINSSVSLIFIIYFTIKRIIFYNKSNPKFNEKFPTLIKLFNNFDK